MTLDLSEVMLEGNALTVEEKGEVLLHKTEKNPGPKEHRGGNTRRRRRGEEKEKERKKGKKTETNEDAATN